MRMALGAQQTDVLWMVLRETVLLVLVGVGSGVPVALAAARLVSILLFGLTPSDPMTIFLAVLVMAAAGVLAGYLPARKASRVDPIVAVRWE